MSVLGVVMELREVNDWPSMLAGPIVRKVTSTDAWIFVATKEPFRAKLLVAHGVLRADQLPDDPDQGIELRPIGAHLYVGLLHATLPVSGSDLVFSYDVQLSRDTGLSPLRLDTLGLLGNPATGPHDAIQGHVPLGYDVGLLPTFMTPPDDPKQLRIAHCSCRKPHGNQDDALEPDALPIVDEIIARAQFFRFEEPADATHPWLDALGNQVTAPTYPPTDLTERPHQLIMTGDQIYADDVAPSLLDAISDAAEKLMGWHEYLPGIVDGLNGFMVEPGWRTRYLSMCGLKEEVTIGETDYPQSHLLRFGEWCAMYLMAWSPSLWPRTADGTKVGLRDATHRLPVSKVVGLLSLYQRLPYNRLRQLAMPYSVLLDKALSSAEASDEFEANRIATWEKYHPRAVQFGSTVPYVRRVMANTATYMMFDDHEITDDWFVDRDVADRLLGIDPPQSDYWGKEVGPRILRNGLSAYAVFQHWGNVPDDFAGWEDETTTDPASGSVGLRLLNYWRPPAPFQRPVLAEPERDDSLLVDDVLAGWWEGGGDDESGPPPVEVEDIWLQWNLAVHDDAHLADDLLRITDYPTDDAGEFPRPGDPAQREAFGRFRWDYAIEFDSHRLIALDTRTWRRFPTEVGALPLIGSVDGNDVIAARDATNPVLHAFATEWIATVDLATRQLGDLMLAISLMLDEATITLDAKIVDVADALDQLISTVAIDPDVEAEAQLLVSDLRAEVDGTASFSTRLPLDSQARYWARAGALLREVAEAVDRSSQGTLSGAVSGSLLAMAAYLDAVVLGSSCGALEALRTVAVDVTILVTVDDVFFAPGPGDVATVEGAGEAAVDDLDPLIAAHQIHERSNAFFRDGTGYLAPELVSAPALEWMVTGPLLDLAPDKETVILSPAPVFADDMVDLVQRMLVARETAFGAAGSEEWEFESWSANPVGLDQFLVAAHSLHHAVVLSGDVHYAYSSVNRARIPIDGVDTTWIQLVSSASKNSDTVNKRIGLGTDIMWDGQGVFRVHQFSPEALLRWDHVEPPPGTPPAPTGPVGSAERFAGWFLEYLEETLEETAREYHLDDLALMLKERFAVRSTPELLAWFARWFAEPALLGVWDVLTQPQQYAQAAWDYLSEAPVTSFTGWIHHSLWSTIDTVHWLHQLREDPSKTIFGHYLYSRDVLLQQIADAYKTLGVDPAYGLTIDKQNLRDTDLLGHPRPDRLMHYGARNRFAFSKPYSMMYANGQEVQVVGNSNVGFVRFVGDHHRLGVRHDICFYPDPSHPGQVVAQPGPWEPPAPPQPDPGEVVGFPWPRIDWMASQHVGWFPEEGGATSPLP